MSLSGKVLIATLALVGCATGPRAWPPDPRAAMLRNCELPEGRTFYQAQHGLQFMQLHLPPRLYAQRNQAPVRDRIACVERWAEERDILFGVQLGAFLSDR